MKHLLTVIIILCQAPLYAQRVMTLAECEDMAFRNNKEIQASYRQIKSMEYQAKSARGNFYPNIKADALGIYNTGKGNMNIEGGNLPVMTPGNDGVPVPSGSFAYFPGLALDYKIGTFFTGGITIEQPIYMGGRISTGYRMAKIGHDIAIENKHLTETDVRLAVANAYAGVVKAQEMDSVACKYKEVLVELLKNVDSGVRNGMATRNDLLKVQVRINEAELMIMKAGNAVRLAKKNLCHTIGMPIDSDIHIISEYPDIEKPSSFSNEITTRPEYRMLESQVELAANQVKFERAAMLPQIGVQAGYMYNNGLKINGDRLMNNGAFNVAVSVTIPIYTFGVNSNKVKAAHARHEQLQLEREYANEAMLLQLSQAADNLSEMIAEVDVAELSLVQADENMRVSGRQYSAGMETLVNYLESQTLWREAYQTKVETRFKLYTTYLDYLKASGRL